MLRWLRLRERSWSGVLGCEGGRKAYRYVVVGASVCASVWFECCCHDVGSVQGLVKVVYRSKQMLSQEL